MSAIRKIQCRHSGERGSALVLVLGVLSLIMVVAVAFLFTSRNSRTIASAQIKSANMVNATNVICLDSLSYQDANLHLIYSKSYRDANPKLSRACMKYGYSSVGNADESEDIIKLLKENSAYVKMLLEDGKFEGYENNDPDNIAGKSGEQILENIGYVPMLAGYDENGSGSREITEKHVVGRCAYVLFDDTGKMDVNAIVPQQSRKPLIKASNFYAAQAGIRDDDFSSSVSEISPEIDDYYSDYFYGLDGTTNIADNRVAATSFGAAEYPLQTLRLGTHVQEIRSSELLRTQMSNSRILASGKAGWNSYDDICEKMKEYDTEHSGDAGSQVARDGALLYRVGSVASVSDTRLPKNVTIGEYNGWCRGGDKFDITGFEWSHFDGGVSIYAGDVDYSLNLANNGWRYKENASSRDLLEELPEINLDTELPEDIYKAYNITDHGTGAYKFLNWMQANPKIAYNLNDYVDADNYATWNQSATGIIAKLEPIDRSTPEKAAKDIGKLVVKDGDDDDSDDDETDEEKEKKAEAYNNALIIGHEAVPYINEIAFNVQLNSQWKIEIDGGAPYYVMTISNSGICPSIEMVNIYGEDFDADNMAVQLFFEGNCVVSLTGGTWEDGRPPEINFGISGYSGDVSSSTVTAGNNIFSPLVNGDVAAKSYSVYSRENIAENYQFNDAAFSAKFDTTDAALVEAAGMSDAVYKRLKRSLGEDGARNQVANLAEANAKAGRVDGEVFGKVDVTFTVDNVVVVAWDKSKVGNFFNPSNPDFLYDLKVIKGTPLEFKVTASIGDPAPACEMSYQLADSRCSGNVSEKVAVATSTLGKDNSNFAPNTLDNAYAGPVGCDKEENVSFDGGDRETYSTAFIRNRPPETIYELGCIHTGEVNQTVNLLDGNKELFDWLKIGPQSVKTGLINPNAGNGALLSTLIDGIDLSRDRQLNNYHTLPVNNRPLNYYSSDWRLEIPWDKLTYQVTDNPVDGLVNYLQYGTFSKTDNSESYTWDKLNDGQREALVGLTVPLLSTDYQYFTLIILQENLEELGELDVAGNTEWEVFPVGATVSDKDKIAQQNGAVKVILEGNVVRYCKPCGYRCTEYHLAKNRRTGELTVLSSVVK